MLNPSTDTARKAMLETLVHGFISFTVIASATVLASLRDIDATAWTAAVGAGIAASGAVSVLSTKVSNGQVTKEAAVLAQLPGGKRYNDPPCPPHEMPQEDHT